MFAKLGAEYVDASQLNISSSLMTPLEESKLEIAIGSTVSSWLHQGNKNFKGVRFGTLALERRLKKQAHHVFSAAVELLAFYAPSKVYIENGRFSLPHSILLACKRKRDLTVVFTGCFIRERRLYAREYRVHDRHSMQTHALKWSQNSDQDEVAKVASEWLTKRRLGHKGEVLFTTLWAEGSQWSGPDTGLALFATSSSDEMSNLDIEWDQGSWDNQFHAFSTIWTHIRRPGLTPVLRVHPNLLNKNPLSALREISEIKAFKSKHPEFVIIWPKSKVSSYELLERSSVVIVYNSTLGLEATLMGKRVLCASSTAYGDIAEVTNVFDNAALFRVTLDSGPTNAKGAQKFVYLQETCDGYVPENPLGVKLATVGVRHILLGISDGSLFSAIYELRWKLFRRVLVLFSPSDQFPKSGDFERHPDLK